MERNTQTTISELKIGDRFYKPTDKKKTVWEKVPGDAVVTKYQTYKNFAITAGEKYPVMMQKQTIVIFLRHKEEVKA
ncbi:MAG: hypothetical protein ACJ749_01020 [Flavisolibacter sp.]|jgi:hypothetical protein